MVKSNKTVASGKHHEDRELAAKTMFESTTVDIQTSQTMILLLASKEEMIILKAISTLDKYASKYEQNAQVLYEDGILKHIIPLLNHTELYIRRFATKLLSELTFLPPVANELLQEEYVPIMMEILNNTEDVVIKEFASLTAAELTKTQTGHDQLLKSNLINVLTPHLLTPDPDVQKNCLQIIFNLIKSSNDHSNLTEDVNFNIKTFIELLMSEYIAIQNLSLDILDILTRQVKGNETPKGFQDAGGVSMLLAILKKFEWKDIHSKCLDVLGNIYNDPNIAQNFLKDGVLQLFNYINLINDPLMRMKAVEVIAKITETPLGRKIVAESGHILELKEMMSEQSAGLTAAVCHCFSKLAQDFNALRQLLDCDTVSELLTVLTDENRDWNDKSAAANTLYQILQRDPQSCEFVLQSDKKDVFEQLLSQFNEDMPSIAACSTIGCITVIASLPELRPKLITRALIASLLGCFKELDEDTMPVKLAACEALSTLMIEATARSHLKALNGLPTIWRALSQHSNNTQVLQAAATLVHMLVVNDKTFVGELQQLDAVNWLLSRRSLRSGCPAWEAALQTLFDKFLPLKFAMTGRLELTDVTESGFYITKAALTRDELNDNKFPILSDLISNKICPMRTLYVANFEGALVTRLSNPLRSKTSSSLVSKQSSKSSASSPSFTCNFDELLLPDAYLLKYIEAVKSILNKNGYPTEEINSTNSVVDSNTVQEKTQMLSEFVAKQLSGLDETEFCSIHNLNLHVNELKVEMLNSIIPVGCLRVGHYTERALLFKVLADRVGLPASLVRGPRGWAWVEVALPKLPPTPRPACPTGLLRPTHVVDLMDFPGTLYPLNSHQADVYCGQLSTAVL